MIRFPHIKFVIAIVGEKAAGKGVVAKILQEREHISILRFSDPIRVADIMHRTAGTMPELHNLAERTAQVFGQKSGGGDYFNAAVYRDFSLQPPGALTLQDMGNTLRARFGAGALAEVLLRIAEILHYSFVVIDGVRNPGEHDLLQKNLSDRFTLLGVTADFAFRKKFFLEKRKRIGDPETEAEFIRLDRRDQGENEPTNGQQVARCLALVKPGDMIVNNGTREELEKKVIKWYTRHTF